MECHIDHANYKNNGLITKLWGEPTWESLHSFTYGYPLEPSEEQKYWYKIHFTSLGYVLPCRYCRESYQKFITTGETALTDEVLQNRDTLTAWLKRVHNAVNNKLEISYAIDKEDLDAKYESFRSKCGKPVKTEKGCVTPLDDKAIAFKKLYYRDAPIVPLETVYPFIQLAKIRGLDEKYYSFLPLAEYFKGDFTKLKKQESWIDRNNFCSGLIKEMRINAVPSIEESGPWVDTPTINELKLLMFLSSNLNRSELENTKKAVIQLLT